MSYVFSVIATFFGVASYIFKLKYCFDFFIPFPFIKFGHSLTYGNPGAMHTKYHIFLDNITILIKFLDSFRFCISLITLHIYLCIHSFLLPYLNFHVFPESLPLINILDRRKNFLQLNLMDRLPHMTHQLVEYCWVITA